MPQKCREPAELEGRGHVEIDVHYIVPELTDGLAFSLAGDTPLDAFLEAKAKGFRTRPVLIGPVTWLTLGKSKTPGFDPLSLLPRVLPVYARLLELLAQAGADQVQIDEPILVRDLSEAEALRITYDTLSGAGPDLLLATYFGGLGDNLDLATALPVHGLHIDLARAPGQLDAVIDRIGDRILSLGLIGGRNI